MQQLLTLWSDFLLLLPGSSYDTTFIWQFISKTHVKAAAQSDQRPVISLWWDPLPVFRWFDIIVSSMFDTTFLVIFVTNIAASLVEAKVRFVLLVTALPLCNGRKWQEILKRLIFLQTRTECNWKFTVFQTEPGISPFQFVEERGILVKWWEEIDHKSNYVR